MTADHAPPIHPTALRLRHGGIEAAWFSDAAASIEVLQVGATALVCIESDACRGEVMAQAHGGSAFDAVGVIVTGSLRMGDARRAVHLQAGAAFSWCSRQSGTFEASHGLRLLQVLMPASQMGSRWPTLVSGDHPRCLEAPDWAVETAHAGLKTLWGRRAEWAASDLADAAAAALDLLARPRQAPRSMQAAELAQVVAQIDASLDDPALGPASLASRLGVSVRTLYALTQRHRTTVGGLIRRRRLEGCRADLLAAGPQASIADIAAMHGFPDPARFSKVFKAEYGMQPREFRRQQRRAEVSNLTL